MMISSPADLLRAFLIVFATSFVPSSEQRPQDTADFVDDYDNVSMFGDEEGGDECFRCLCAASSDCRPNTRCRIIEPEHYLCGPFRLSEAYWRLGGSLRPPGVPPGHPMEFELCAHNVRCALETVRRVLGRYMAHCGLLDTFVDDSVKRCLLVSFVHYRLVYLDTSLDYEDYDSDNNNNNKTKSTSFLELVVEDQDDDEDEEAKEEEMLMSCRVDVDNIETEIEQMLDSSLATRGDDRYWARFADCSTQFVASND